jgi:hypothetical protein
VREIALGVIDAVNEIGEKEGFSNKQVLNPSVPAAKA